MLFLFFQGISQHNGNANAIQQESFIIEVWMGESES